MYLVHFFLKNLFWVKIAASQHGSLRKLAREDSSAVACVAAWSPRVAFLQWGTGLNRILS